jgi:hypothetical protein
MKLVHKVSNYRKKMKKFNHKINNYYKFKIKFTI